MDRDAQGCAWASQAGAVLSNPFASELARDSENPSPILLRKWPCILLSTLVAPAHLALRANLRLLLIRASLRRLTLRAALAVSRAAAQPPGSAHLPRCLVVYILVI
jgi:hypothetical protein